MADRAPPQPSFKTDVNRHKTQRWVEAKQASYDGGDWAGYDEYDDIDDDDEPTQPAKPTGLRQRGQDSLSAKPPSSTPPPHSQQFQPSLQSQYSQPSLQSKYSQQPHSSRPRAPSFESGDDRPESKQSAPPHNSPRRPSLDFPPQESPTLGRQQSNQPQILPGPYPGPHADTSQRHYNQPPRSGPSPPVYQNRQQRAPSNPSQFPSLQTNLPQASPRPAPPNQAHRNPPAPSPTYNRGPGALPVDLEPLSAKAFPPRKSSLTSMKRPSLGSLQQSGSEQNSPRQPSPNSPAIPQPSTGGEGQSQPRFIRPADIYKRVEEEKERERQSMDSQRPSLDSIERAGRRTSGDSAREADPVPRLKPTLDTVAERRSEYGMDGLLLRDPSHSASGGLTVPNQAPMLPQLDRFSGFGSDLLGNDASTIASRSSQDQPRSPIESQQTEPVEPPSVEPSSTYLQHQPSSPVRSQEPVPVAAPTVETSSTSLQHQPSQGYRSVVEKAFDGNDDHSGPSSGRGSQRSNDNSNVSRSDTNSTSGISPIMSRVPSAATAAQKSQERDERLASTPAIPEETFESGQSDSRPTSSRTLQADNQLTGFADSHHSRGFSGDSASTAVISGYRRDKAPPGSRESPRRTPDIRSNEELQQSTEGEISMTTPVESVASTDTQHSSPLQESPVMSSHEALDYNKRESDLADRINASPEHRVPGVGMAEHNAQTSFVQSHSAASSTSNPALQTIQSSESTSGRPDSPRTKVRDLASKYNELHESTRSKHPSRSGSVSSWASSNRYSPGKELSSPIAGPMTQEPEQSSYVESRSAHNSTSNLRPAERPRLPGEWVSYANSTASGMTTREQSADDQYHSTDAYRRQPPQDTHRNAPSIDSDSDSEVDLAPTTAKHPLAAATDPTSHPLTALSAAGSALADSVKQTVGVGQPENQESSSDDEERQTERDTLKPPPMNRDTPSPVSTVGPTPPAKDTPRAEGSRPRSSGYFPAPAPLRVINRDSPGPQQSEENSAVSNDSSHLSMNLSDSDSENDRLRKDIYKSLSPPMVPSKIDEAPHAEQSLAPDHAYGSSARTSAVIPSEYDTYWDSRSAQNMLNREDSQDSEHAGIEAPGQGFRQSHHLKQFSWEKDHTRGTSFSGVQVTGPDDNHGMRKGSSSATSEDVEPLTKGVIDPAELESPAPVSDSLQEIKPSPIELPGDSERQMSTSDESPLSNRRDSGDRDMKPVPIPTSTARSGSTTTKTARPLAELKAPMFRDIQSMKLPSQRIEAYNSARNQVIVLDTGLSDWLGRMAGEQPDLKQMSPVKPRPMLNAGGMGGSMSMRKISPSLTKLARGVSDGPSPASSNPDSASPGMSSPNQSLRKELFHSAGVFGGKATTGAKGLLAKGKSRLKPSTEKVD